MKMRQMTVGSFAIIAARACWVLGVLSGVALLFGVAVPVAAHMVLGAVMELLLLLLAVQAARCAPVMAAAGFLVALLLAACGWVQYDPALLGGVALMPEMVAHVLLAVAAMGLSEMMAKKIRLSSVM